MATFGFDENKNKKEVYTREEVLSILQQAIDDQSLEDIDPSIVPTPAKIKEIRNNNTVAFWVGTEAQFEALGVNVGYCIARIDNNKNVYIITDDSALDSINAELQQAAKRDTEWQTNTPRLFNDTGVHSTPTNNYTDYENAKIGDLLINSTGLYFCRILNVSTNFIEWLRIYDFRNEMPNFYKENSATPSTDPADYANLKLGDFVYTNNNILYFCNALSDQYCGWARVARYIDLISKQDVLTAGDNIDITNNVISALTPEYELIKEIELDTDNPTTSSLLYNKSAGEYDDVFLVMEDILAEATAGINIAIRTTANDSISGNAYFTRANCIDTNTARKFYIKIERINSEFVDQRWGGTYQQTNISKLPNNPTYDDKITYFYLYTAANQGLTQGTIKLYGRKRF